MGEFHGGGHERVHAFELGEAYLFKHYFEERAVFAELSQFYNGTEYRFELPASAFERVRSFLDGHGYALVPVADVEEFTVCHRMYSRFPEFLFTEAVYREKRGDYEVFVLPNGRLVERAVNEGSKRIGDTTLSLDE